MFGVVVYFGFNIAGKLPVAILVAHASYTRMPAKAQVASEYDDLTISVWTQNLRRANSGL